MHAIGLLTWCLSSTYFTDLTSNPRADVMYLGISMLIPWGLLLPPSVTEIRSLRFFLLLECSLAAAAVSLINFSLALCFALVAVPVLIKCTMDNDSKPRALVRTALALACHPAGIYAMFLFYGRPILGYSEKPVVLKPDILISALLRLLKEHLVYGSNVLPLLLVLVLPMWNLMLPLALVKIKTAATETAEPSKAENQEKKQD
ncbi:hypothetical protein GCK32_018991 [Trichostrongylus colubriformis]|uniref:Uncharacterized protein n=1 Tax=Trichostrongylus colubriformis TaxID=6319 RepID=A0AAN8FGI9_TRICO